MTEGEKGGSNSEPSSRLEAPPLAADSSSSRASSARGSGGSFNRSDGRGGTTTQAAAAAAARGRNGGRGRGRGRSRGNSNTGRSRGGGRVPQENGRASTFAAVDESSRNTNDESTGEHCHNNNDNDKTNATTDGGRSGRAPSSRGGGGRSGRGRGRSGGRYGNKFAATSGGGRGNNNGRPPKSNRSSACSTPVPDGVEDENNAAVVLMDNEIPTEIATASPPPIPPSNNNRTNKMPAALELVEEPLAQNTTEMRQDDHHLPPLSATSVAPPTRTPSTTTATTTSPMTTLLLPTPPQLSGGNRNGMPLILSRQSHPPPVTVVDYDSEAQRLAERLAVAALEEDGEDEPEEKTEIATQVEEVKPVKKQPRKGKYKKKHHDTASSVPNAEMETLETVELSPSETLMALPAQSVSISANTMVQVRRVDSAASLSKMDVTTSAKSKVLSKKSKPKKKKGLSKDDAANQRAARNFNRAVRTCVERSDPDAMREILHDRANHNFALDPQVLETVLKAYVMAAMFEDALYCLRNCALPGTLSTQQAERILTCLPQNLRNSSAYTAADMINALCIATEFDQPTSRTYFLRIVRGISLEFLEEATSARDRICSAPCERLVRSAVCIVDARLKRGKKITDLMVVPGHQLGVFVPDTLENRGIQAGDAVSILPYAGPYPMSAESLDRNMIEATVTNTNPMVLRLQDKTNVNLYAGLTENVEGNVHRIDKLANRMGFNRQLAAAVAIASPLGDSRTRDTRRPSPELIKAITAMDENIDRVMKQSGGLQKGEMTSTAALCTEAVPWNYEDEGNIDADSIRATSALALAQNGALEGLNESQRLAVEGAVTNRLTLVQGPPGTGKTAVAIRILQHWARLAASEATNGQGLAPILATSDSNIAVDNLVEGCANVGLRVVRLGRPEAIRPELLRFCIDRPPSAYSASANAAAFPTAATNSSVPPSAFKDKLKNLKNAQVVCCTCIGSGGDILDGMTFDRVLVDEATQATEPAVLVPLTRGCRQLVLVGDHCQLPPTVLSTRAEEEGHGVPLFSRMVACGVTPFMLDTQYRMHPCIAMFPSDLFYGGKLRNGVSAPERRPLAGFPWPREEFPVAFIPVKGVEVDDGVSKLNEEEAATACRVVESLLSGGQCSAADIAVVTPYAAQARLIRRLTRQLTQNNGPPYLEVSSVDGFQGREKEAVVFSSVRSNDYGAIGFTSDWRRVNVSFTRARRALIVIGNDQTLRRGDPDTWMPWLAWADAHGINMDKPGVPRGRYDPEQLRRVRGGTTAAEMLKHVLERQQAQLKTAEKQLEKAEQYAAGHIVGRIDDEDGVLDKPLDLGNKPLTLGEDLARMANTEGNWDDSEDEEDKNELHPSVSQPTLASATSSNDIRIEGSDEDAEIPQDAWDL